MFGCLPLLQSNQLTQIVRSMFFEPQGWFVGLRTRCSGECFIRAVTCGACWDGGGRRNQANWCLCRTACSWNGSLYGGTSLVIILLHADQIFPSLSLILSDAFTGQAVAGGALGMVIVTGVRRAAFSNEAGMGTEAMAHGAAKTKEPIREGLVAMWGPVIDTLLMCTLTGLVLMVTDVWRSGEGRWCAPDHAGI